MASTIDSTRYPYVVHEDTVSGTYDGSNTTFVTRWTPNTQSTKIYNSSGQYLREGTDYTRSGKTLTATVAPETGDNWVADYSTGG